MWISAWQCLNRDGILPLCTGSPQQQKEQRKAVEIEPRSCLNDCLTFPWSPSSPPSNEERQCDRQERGWDSQTLHCRRSPKFSPPHPAVSTGGTGSWAAPRSTSRYFKTEPSSTCQKHTTGAGRLAAVTFLFLVYISNKKRNVIKDIVHINSLLGCIICFSMLSVLIQECRCNYSETLCANKWTSVINVPVSPSACSTTELLSQLGQAWDQKMNKMIDRKQYISVDMSEGVIFPMHWSVLFSSLALFKSDWL